MKCYRTGCQVVGKVFDGEPLTKEFRYELVQRCMSSDISIHLKLIEFKYCLNFTNCFALYLTYNVHVLVTYDYHRIMHLCFSL
jgi:hypothetical protein